MSVHWDLAFTSVDVSFGGNLLTKITDVGHLRSTGLAGTAPDGSTLHVRLGAGDTFEVMRNGERLDVSATVVPDHPPDHTPATSVGSLLTAPSQKPGKLSLDSSGRLMIDGVLVDERSLGIAPSADQRVDASAVRNARTWLLLIAIFHSLTLAVLLLNVAKVNVVLGVIFVFQAGITSGTWYLWKVAGGPNARKAFAISKWIAVFYMAMVALSVAGSLSQGKLFQGVLGAIVPGAISFGAFAAFDKARATLPEN